MQKYFKEEGARIKLSLYIKSLEDKCVDGKDSALREAQYLYDCLGDVELEKTQLKVFHDLFHTTGGKYDVRTEPETIKGLYRISMRHPDLSKRALEEIASRYIDDFFKAEALEIKLAKILDVFGPIDEAFIVFLQYVDLRAKEYEKQYEEEAKKLDACKKEYQDVKYGLDYITYLKALVTRKHIPASHIIDKMPTADLIKQDIKKLSDFDTKPSISIGMGLPLSYKMTASYAKYGDLDAYDEDLYYFRSTDGKVLEASFTKQDFIDSVREKGIRKTR